MPIPPLNPNYTNTQLLAVIRKWGRKYNKPGISIDDDEDGEDSEVNLFVKRPSADNLSDSSYEGRKLRRNYDASE